MHDEHIFEHIEQAACRPERETRQLITRIVSGCWPGGSSDRSEPAALAWLRSWRPERLGTKLPACSCRRGHCLLCN